MLRKTVSIILCITLLTSVFSVFSSITTAAQTVEYDTQHSTEEFNVQKAYEMDISNLLNTDLFPEEEIEPQAEFIATESPTLDNFERTDIASGRKDMDIAPVAARPETTCGDYTYEIIDDLVYITGYIGTDTEVVFPARIDDKDVYGIEPNGKNNCIPRASVTKLIISEGIQVIGDNAFRRLPSLETVQLNSQLTTIGNESFRDCTALSQINFPSTLKQLALRSFNNCGFVELEVPGTIEDLGMGAFLGCQKLKKAVLGEGIEEIYSPFAECHALEEVTLPSTLKRMVHDGTFNTCYSLTHIELPDGLEEICDYAFDRATSLKSIVIPDSVKTIGKGVFIGCNSLESVKLPKGITTIPEFTFSACSSLKECIVPDAVVLIDGSAFRGSGIEKITIPESVTTIGNAAFSYCSNLNSITLPNNLLIIGEYAFQYCGIQTIMTPENVTEICKGAFKNCYSLIDVSINSKSAVLGEELCYGCKNLEKVTLSDGVTEIGKASFWGCEKLTDFRVPKSVIALSDNMFRYCSSLQNVTLHEDLTQIGNETFRDCTALSEIEFPASLKKLAFRSFNNCGFVELKVPATIEDLGIGAFLGCQKLKKAVLCEGIEEIYSPFAECHALEEVTLPSTLKRMVHDGTFNTCYSLTHIELPDGLEEICDYAFDRATSLKSIVIPDSVKTIGKGVFRECSSLESVKLSKNITAIREDSFVGCKSLKEQLIFDNVTVVGDRAFQNCAGLVNVSLPDSLTTIGKYAFADCTSLQSVTIPEKVTRLDYGVFKNCTSLKDVYANDNISFIGRCVRNYWQWDDGAFQNSGNYLDNEDVVIHCGKYSRTAREILNRVSPNDFVQIDFSSIERSKDTSILDTESSAYMINSGVMMKFVCNYAFKDDIYDTATDKYVLIRMPVGMELVSGYIYLDREKITNYSYISEDRIYKIPVSAKSGRIQLGASTEDNSYNLRTYAALQCKLDSEMITETIDIYNENVDALAISTESFTSTGSVTIVGSGPKSREIEIYVNDALCTTVTSNKVGTFSAIVSIPDPVNTMTYSVRAVSTNIDGKEISAEAFTQYYESAPKLTWFRLKKRYVPSAGVGGFHNSGGQNSGAIGFSNLDGQTKDYLDNGYDLLNPNCKIRMTPASAESYYYELGFDSNEKIENIILSSTKDGKTAYYNVLYDDTKKVYYTNTILLDYEKQTEYYREYHPSVSIQSSGRATENRIIPHLPGRLSLVVENKPVEQEYNYRWARSRVNSVKFTSGAVDHYSVNIKHNTPTHFSSSVDYTYNEKTGSISTDTFTKSLDNFVNENQNYANDIVNSREIGTTPDNMPVENPVTNRDVQNAIKENWQRFEDASGHNQYMNYSYNDNNGNFSINVYDSTDNTVTCCSFDMSRCPSLSEALNAFGIDQKYVERTGLVENVFGIAATTVDNVLNFMDSKSRLDFLKNEIENGDYTLAERLELDKYYRVLKVYEYMDRTILSIAAIMRLGSDVPILGQLLTYLANSMEEITTDFTRSWLRKYWGLALNIVYSNSPFIWIIDPSGYVYAGLESNRISDAVTTVYGIIRDEEEDDDSFWDKPDESRQEKWHAIEYDQMNPLITDEFGNYAWDVPEGWWRVVVEKDGYETYSTEWLPVPPPQMDVNINLISTQKPALERWEQTDEGILLSFVDPILPDSLNIMLTNPDGTLSPVNLQYDEEKSPDGETLVKNCILELPSDHQEGKYLLTISNAKTYSGMVGDIAQIIVVGEGILGDVDGDGEVTIVDATYIQRKLASIPIPFEFNDSVADTDADNSVTIIDATYIQRWLANLKSNDNIGKQIT